MLQHFDYERFMLHLFSLRNCLFTTHPSSTSSRLTLAVILAGILATASLTSSLAIAESNVAGVEITIYPDDVSKNSTKDLTSKDANNENVGITKSVRGKSPYTIDNQQPNAINDQQDIITLGNDDLWQRIKDGYDMPDSTSPLVTKHEDWYRSRPDYIKRMVERSQKYLFHIVEEVEKRGMPTEIALLPMIESAYNPQAYSTGSASGIWQFIPSTGKHFGLKQNWWVDNRRNIMFATDAALNYLQKLYGMFGSWDLALAAYNAGEGTVGRAIERNKKLGLPTDYESLNLPPETKNYVPKLQAIKNLMTNPGDYGLKIQTIANTPYFARVSAPIQIDAHLAAKLAEISDDEFLALNPSYKRPVITSSGEKHELLLPILSAQTFRNNLATYDKPLVSWRTYIAKRGERLESIASKFGIQLAKLRNVNNLPVQNKIKNAGAILVPNGNSNDFNASSEIKNKDQLPELAIEANRNLSTKQDSDNIDLSSAENNTTSSPEKSKAENEPTKQQSVIYTVKKGDTMLSISRHFHVSTKQIMLSNKLKKSHVKVGQELNITFANENQKAAKIQSKNQPKKESIKTEKIKKSAKTSHLKSKSNANNKAGGKTSSVKHKNDK